jgi:cytochrome c-type biogenesis protein
MLDGEHRLPFTFDTMRMSPWTALAMGFVISFAWSPCIGPMLSSVLILAATSGAAGFLYIGVYTVGYILPFLITGLFTTTLLDFFGKNRNVVKYTAKIGGVLMIIMGILMISGKMNGLTSYLSTVSAPKQEVSVEADADEDAVISEDASEEADARSDEADASEEDQPQGQVLPAPEFTLTDQYGQVHSLADYRGKVVFLNFWATWCPPCREEMPYIQELYEEYSAQEDPEVVFLSVAFPNMGNEQDVDGIKAFLEENGYTYPALMDEGATLALPYYITAYPTTFLINPDGEVLFYIPGGMTKETMQEAIRQALEQSK